MKGKLTLVEAANLLAVSRARVEEWIAARYLPEPDDVGLLEVKAVQGLERMLRELEVGLLGFGELPEPPAVVTSEQAAHWLGTSAYELELLALDGVLESVPWSELSDDEVVEVVLGVEAAAPEETWSEADALLVDLITWWVRRLRRPLPPKHREQARELLPAETFFRTPEVRALARRRARFNPPELEAW